MIGSVFLIGTWKCPSFFNSRLAALPPLLPVVADDVGHQHLLDLVGRGLAAVTIEDEADEFEVVRARELAQPLQIRRPSGQEYAPWRWA